MENWNMEGKSQKREVRILEAKEGNARWNLDRSTCCVIHPTLGKNNSIHSALAEVAGTAVIRSRMSGGVGGREIVVSLSYPIQGERSVTLGMDVKNNCTLEEGAGDINKCIL